MPNVLDAVLLFTVITAIVIAAGDIYRFMATSHISSRDRRLWDSVEVGSCFRLSNTQYGKRPEYCVIVGKRINKKKLIFDYKIIAYDHFFKRYEEGDIVISCGVNEFFGEYGHTGEDIDYFKYEKFT